MSILYVSRVQMRQEELVSSVKVTKDVVYSDKSQHYSWVKVYDLFVRRVSETYSAPKLCLRYSFGLTALG